MRRTVGALIAAILIAVVGVTARAGAGQVGAGAQDEPIYWYSIPVVAQRDAPMEEPLSIESASAADIGAGAADLGVQLWRCLPHGVTRQLGPRVRKYLTQ